MLILYHGLVHYGNITRLTFITRKGCFAHFSDSLATICPKSLAPQGFSAFLRKNFNAFAGIFIGCDLFFAVGLLKNGQWH
jgi:hypothetical protein